MATQTDTLGAISATEKEGGGHLTTGQFNSAIHEVSPMVSEKLNDRLNQSHEHEACDIGVETLNFHTGNIGAEEGESFLVLPSANKVHEEISRPELHLVDEIENRAEKNTPKEESRLHEDKKFQTAGETGERIENEDQIHDSVAGIETTCQHAKIEEPNFKAEGDETSGKSNEITGYETLNKGETVMETCKKDDKQTENFSSSFDEDMGIQEIRPSKVKENEEHEEESIGHHFIGDISISTAGESQQNPTNIEGISEIRETFNDKLDRASVKLETEEPIIHEGEPKVHEEIKEENTIACDDDSRDITEASEKMNDTIPVAENKNFETPFVRQTEELCTQKVDNPETFQVDTKIPEEEENQTELLKKTAQTDSTTSENGDSGENYEKKLHITLKNDEEGMLIKGEALAMTEASERQKRGTEGLIILSEDNIGSTEFIEPDHKNADGLLQHKEPELEKLEKSLNVAFDEDETLASSDNTERTACIKCHEESFDGRDMQEKPNDTEDISEERVPVHKNFSPTDSHEKTEGAQADLSNSNKNAYDLPVTHSLVETVQVESENIDKISKVEPEEPVDGAFIEDNIENTSEAYPSTERKNLQETSTEGTVTAVFDSKTSEDTERMESDGKLEVMYTEDKNVQQENRKNEEAFDTESRQLDSTGDDIKEAIIEEDASSCIKDMTVEEGFEAKILEETGPDSIADDRSADLHDDVERNSILDKEVYELSICTGEVTKGQIIEANVTHLLPESIDRETINNFQDCEKEAENLKGEVIIEQTIKEGKDEEPSPEVIGAAESAKCDTNQDNAGPERIFDTSSLVKQEECLQGHDENQFQVELAENIDEVHQENYKVEAKEENETSKGEDYKQILQTDEPEEDLTRSLNVTFEETDVGALCKDTNITSMEEAGDIQNLKESSENDKKEDEAKCTDYTKDNENAKEDDLKLVPEASEETKSTQKLTLVSETNTAGQETGEKEIDSVKDHFPESSEKETTEDDSKEDQVYMGLETPVSSLITEKNMEEDTKAELSSSLVVEETVKNIPKDEECNELNLNKEVRNTDLEFTKQIEATGSIEETKSEILEETADTSKDLDALNTTKASEQEINPREHSGILDEKSSFDSEELGKEVDKEEPSFNDSGVTDVTVVTKEISLQEAEQEEKGQLKCSDLDLEEKGLATKERNNVMPDEEIKLEDNGQKEIQTVNDDSEETLEHPIQHETPNMESKDKKEENSTKTIVDYVQEDNLHDSSAMPSKEQYLVPSEMSEVTDETPAINETPNEEVQMHGREEIFMPLELGTDEHSSEPKRYLVEQSELCKAETVKDEESLDPGSELGKSNDGNPFNETSTSSADDTPTGPTLEEEDHAKNFGGSLKESIEVGKEAVELDAEAHSLEHEAANPDNYGNLTEKNIQSADPDEKLECTSKSVAVDEINDFQDQNSLSVEEHMNEQRLQEGEKEIETKLMVKDHIGETQNADETVQGIILAVEQHEGDEKARKSESIIEHVIDEESDKKDFDTVSVEVETLNQVKDIVPVSTEYLESTDTNDQEVTLYSPVEEEPIREQEAIVGEEVEEDKDVPKNQSNEILHETIQSQKAELSTPFLETNSKLAEEQIFEQRPQEGEKEIEPKLMVEDHADETQNANETIKGIILTEKLHEGIAKANESENIREHVRDEESDKHDHETVFDGVGTLDQVKDYGPVSTEYLKQTDKNTEAGTLNSEVVKDPTREREVSLEEELDENKGAVENQSIETLPETKKSQNDENSNDFLGRNSESVEQIIEQRPQEGEKETAEPQFTVDDHVDETQSQNETAQSINLTDKPYEGVENANEIESIKKLDTKEDGDKTDIENKYVGSKILDEAKASSTVSPEYLKATDNKEQAGSHNSEVEEEPTREIEASFAEKLDEENKGPNENQSNETLLETNQNQIAERSNDSQEQNSKSGDQQIIGQRPHESEYEIKEDVEPELMVEDQTDEAQIQNETAQAIILTDEPHEGLQKASDSENIRNRVTDEERDKNDLEKACVEVEMQKEIKALEQAENLKSEDKEHPTREREASFEGEMEEDKGVADNQRDVTLTEIKKCQNEENRSYEIPDQNSISVEQQTIGQIPQVRDMEKEEDVKPQVKVDDHTDGTQSQHETSQAIDLPDKPHEGTEKAIEVENIKELDTEEDSNVSDIETVYVRIKTIDEVKASCSLSPDYLQGTDNNEHTGTKNSEVEEDPAREREALLEEELEEDKGVTENQRDATLPEINKCQNEENSNEILDQNSKSVEQQITGQISQKGEMEKKEDVEPQVKVDDHIHETQSQNETSQVIDLPDKPHEGIEKAIEIENIKELDTEEDSNRSDIETVYVGIKTIDENKASGSVSPEDHQATDNNEQEGTKNSEVEKDPAREKQALLEEELEKDKGVAENQRDVTLPEINKCQNEENSNEILDQNSKSVEQQITGQIPQEGEKEKEEDVEPQVKVDDHIYETQSQNETSQANDLPDKPHEGIEKASEIENIKELETEEDSNRNEIETVYMGIKTIDEVKASSSVSPEDLQATDNNEQKGTKNSEVEEDSAREREALIEEELERDKGVAENQRDVTLPEINKCQNEENSNEILDQNSKSVEQQITGQIPQKGEKEKEEDVEPQVKVDDHAHETQSQNETSQAIDLPDKPHEGTKKAIEIENIKKLDTEEDSNRSDIETVYVEVKTIDEVKSFDSVSPEDHQSIDNNEQEGTKNSEVEEDPAREREALLEEELEEDKGVAENQRDVTLSEINKCQKENSNEILDQNSKSIEQQITEQIPQEGEKEKEEDVEPQVKVDDHIHETQNQNETSQANDLPDKPHEGTEKAIEIENIKKLDTEEDSNRSEIETVYMGFKTIDKVKASGSVSPEDLQATNNNEQEGTKNSEVEEDPAREREALLEEELKENKGVAEDQRDVTLPEINKCQNEENSNEILDQNSNSVEQHITGQIPQKGEKEKEEDVEPQVKVDDHIHETQSQNETSQANDLLDKPHKGTEKAIEIETINELDTKEDSNRSDIKTVYVGIKTIDEVKASGSVSSEYLQATDNYEHTGTENSEVEEDTARERETLLEEELEEDKSVVENQRDVTILEINKSQIEENSNDILDQNSMSVEQQIIGQIPQEGEKEINDDVEPQFMFDDHIDESQSQNETTQAISLTDKPHEGAEKAIENIKEPNLEGKCDKNDLEIVHVGVETLNEVRALDSIPTEYLKATDNYEQAEMLKFEAEEDLTREREVSLEKEVEEDKGVAEYQSDITLPETKKSQNAENRNDNMDHNSMSVEQRIIGQSSQEGETDTKEHAEPQLVVEDHIDEIQSETEIIKSIILTEPHEEVEKGIKSEKTDDRQEEKCEKNEIVNVGVKMLKEVKSSDTVPAKYLKVTDSYERAEMLKWEAEEVPTREREALLEEELEESKGVAENQGDVPEIDKSQNQENNNDILDQSSMSFEQQIIGQKPQEGEKDAKEDLKSQLTVDQHIVETQNEIEIIQAIITTEPHEEGEKANETESTKEHLEEKCDKNDLEMVNIGVETHNEVEASDSISAKDLKATDNYKQADILNLKANVDQTRERESPLEEKFEEGKGAAENQNDATLPETNKSQNAEKTNVFLDQDSSSVEQVTEQGPQDSKKETKEDVQPQLMVEDHIDETQSENETIQTTSLTEEQHEGVEKTNESENIIEHGLEEKCDKYEPEIVNIEVETLKKVESSDTVPLEYLKATDSYEQTEMLKREAKEAPTSQREASLEEEMAEDKDVVANQIDAKLPETNKSDDAEKSDDFLDRNSKSIEQQLIGQRPSDGEKETKEDVAPELMVQDHIQENETIQTILTEPCEGLEKANESENINECALGEKSDKNGFEIIDVKALDSIPTEYLKETDYTEQAETLNSKAKEDSIREREASFAEKFVEDKGIVENQSDERIPEINTNENADKIDDFPDQNSKSIEQQLYGQRPEDGEKETRDDVESQLMVQDHVQETETVQPIILTKEPCEGVEKANESENIKRCAIEEKSDKNDLEIVDVGVETHNEVKALDSIPTEYLTETDYFRQAETLNSKAEEDPTREREASLEEELAEDKGVVENQSEATLPGTNKSENAEKSDDFLDQNSKSFEQQLIGQRPEDSEKETKEDVESQFMVEDHIDKSQIENETAQAINLTEEPNEGIEKFNEILNIKEHMLEEESDKNNLKEVGVETLKEVSASGPLSAEYLKASDNYEQETSLKSEVEEHSTRDREASLEETLEVDKVVSENQRNETISETNNSPTAETSTDFLNQKSKSCEQQIIGLRPQEDEKETQEDVEPKLMIKDHIDETQSQNETIQTINLTEEAYEGFGKANENENIKELPIEEEDDKNYAERAYHGVETLSEVKTFVPESTEYLKAADKCEQREPLDLRFEADPTREREAFLDRELEGERGVLKNLDTFVEGESEENINVEIIDRVDGDKNHTAETSLVEAQLDNNTTKGFDSNLHERIPGIIQTTEASLQGEEVHKMKVEEASSNSVSQITTSNCEKAEQDSAHLDNVEAIEVSASIFGSETVLKSQDQSFEEIGETETVKSLNVEKLDAVETEANATANTAETNLAETLLDDKLGEVISISSDDRILKENEITEVSPSGDEVESMRLEAASSDLVSQPTIDRENVKDKRLTGEIPDADEIEESKITSDTDFKGKYQGVEETDGTQKIPSVEKLDADDATIVAVITAERSLEEAHVDKTENLNAEETDDTVKKITSGKCLEEAHLNTKENLDADETATTVLAIKTEDSLKEAQLHTEPVKAFASSSDGSSLEAVSTTEGYGEEVNSGRMKLDKTISDKTCDLSTIDHVQTEKESKSLENPNTDEVAETKTGSGEILDSKDQSVEGTEDTRKCPIAEKLDGDESEEEIKQISETKSKSQGAEAPCEDINTGDHQAEKLEEQIETASPAFITKEKFTCAITAEKIEEGNMKEVKTQENFSTEKITEEACSQKEEARELNVSKLGLELTEDLQKDSPNKVKEEENRTSDGALELEAREIEESIKFVDSPPESENIEELKPVKETSNSNFERSEKTSESLLEAHSHEVPNKTKDTEIVEKYLETAEINDLRSEEHQCEKTIEVYLETAEINDLRSEEHQCEKTIEVNKITNTEALNEEITAEKEISKESHPVSLTEKPKESHQEELKAEEIPREMIDETSMTTTKLQDELPGKFETSVTRENVEKQIAAEDKIVKYNDVVSVDNETIRDGFPYEAEGKNVAEEVIELDHENQDYKTNSGNSTADATALRDEETSREISQKEVTREILEANYQQLEQTSHGKAEMQIPRETDPNDRKESVTATVSKDVPPPLLNQTAETIDVANIKDLQPGNDKAIDLVVKDVQSGEEIRMGEICEKATASISIDSSQNSLSDIFKSSTKDSFPLAKQQEQKANEEEMQTEVEHTIKVEEDPKTDEEEVHEHKKSDTDSDPPVMVEASKDIDAKAAHKKSHNILSGVGSKVKHSISKVKKAITGKSSHPKILSPK